MTEYGILLDYPTGPVTAFRFGTREEAQRHLDSTLATMHPKRIDSRWAHAEVVAHTTR